MDMQEKFSLYVPSSLILRESSHGSNSDFGDSN